MLSGAQVMGRDTISAIAEACPQLQHLCLNEAFVAEPAFAALQDMSCLSSLALVALSTLPNMQAAVLSSLPAQLSGLTKLKLSSSWRQPSNQTIPVPTSDMLPWASTLHQLRDLELGFPPIATGEEVPGHLSSLSLLTRLEVREARVGWCCIRSSYGLAALPPHGALRWRTAWKPMQQLVLPSTQEQCGRFRQPTELQLLHLDNLVG